MSLTSSDFPPPPSRTIDRLKHLFACSATQEKAIAKHLKEYGDVIKETEMGLYLQAKSSSGIFDEKPQTIHSTYSDLPENNHDDNNLPKIY